MVVNVCKMKIVEIFMALFTLFNVIQISESQLAETTIYDGIKSPYNQFIKFSGGQGVQASISYSGITSYTFSIWIRLDAYPWDVRNDFSVFSCSPDCFSLAVTRSTKAIRASGNRSGFLSVDGNIRLQNWCIIVIKSNSTNSLLQTRDLAFKLLNSDSQSQFFPQGISQLSFNSFIIGINQDRQTNGFQGSIRNLKLFSGILTDSQTQRIQFIYVIPRREQLLQVIMQNVETLKNEGDRATFTLIQRNGNLANQVDFIGNINCSELPNTRLNAFLRLSRFTTLSAQTFTASQISNTNYDTSMQMWVKRIQAPLSVISDPTEVLYDHQGISKLSFTTNDNTNMIIQGRQNGIQTTLRFPHSRWMFIQMSSTQQQVQVSLFDDENQPEGAATLQYTSTQSSISRTIVIAQNFNGFIFGIKIYKQAFPVTLGPHSFTYSIEQNQNALIYFMLQRSGQGSGAFVFQNLIQYDAKRTIAATGQLQYINEPLINSTYSYTSGNKDGPLVFDGASCIDNREKAYMSTDKSYLSSSLSTNRSLTQYTIEFWAKRTQSLTGSAFYTALAFSNSADTIYPAIIQNSGRLICYPFYTSDKSISVTYNEYVSNINRNLPNWIHVSCTYDQANSWVIGQLLQSNEDYLYKSSFTSSSLNSLPKQNYILFVNSNPATKDNGFQQIYYAEIRFWSYARTQTQVRQQRLMRLNTSAEMQNLYSYMKLGYSNYNGIVNELDYADYSLSKQIQFTSVQWISNTDLLICPDGFSRGLSDTSCYRDSLIDLQLSVYKKDENSFVISPAFSSFRTSYFQDYYKDLFQYTWSLTSTVTQNSTNTQIFPRFFNPQSQSPELVFRYDQVTDAPGRYTFRLIMTDLAQLQTALTSTITLAAKQCANIFDADTGLSYVYKDMNNTKNSQPTILTYNYTNCFDYIFDSSSLQFGINLNSIRMTSSDHDAKAQTIRIRETIQSSIPANEYFFIRVMGTWRNPNNRNDILQYSVLYGCRYIAKLVLSLRTNYLIATKGNTVTISYTAIVANLNTGSSSQRGYSLYWSCPPQIQSVCAQFNNTNLILFYDQVVNSGMSLYQPQTIYLNGITNFVQGDSSNTAQASISITWIDVTPDGDLTLLTPVPTNSSNVAFQFSVTSLTENQIDLRWNLSPEVNSACLINANNRRQYVIQGSCLRLNTNYTVKVTLSYKGVSTSELNSRSQIFSLRNLPSGGTFSCNSTSGLAISITINCTARNYIGMSQPLRYQYLALDSSGNIQALSPISILPSAAFNPIPSTRIQLRVFDGDYKYQTQQLTINFQQSNYTNTTWITINNLLQQIESVSQSAQLNTDMYRNIQTIAAYLIQNQGLIPTPFSLQTISRLIFAVSSQYDRIKPNDNRDQIAFFIQGSIQAFSLISNYTAALDLPSFNSMQKIILGSLSKFSTVFDFLVTDSDFLKNLFNMQSTIISTLNVAQKNNGFSSLSTNEQIQSSNITAQLRQILNLAEQSISKTLFEGETYSYKSTVFNISITKYSRSANILYDFVSQSSNSLNFSFPLSSALQPTDRQTFTVINFEQSPFIGSFFRNQSALVDSSIYFAYRDEKGQYLNGENVLGQIVMKFNYPEARLNNPLNQTVCGYIGSSDTQWENSSCSTTFDSVDGYVICSCNHMSYYSVIDDSLVREYRVTKLGFVNWVSLIPFGYILIIFIIGLIYTYSKDNSDFQQLNQQDKTLGHDLIDGNSVTIKTLLFKRKVFYTGFGSKFSSCTLFRILFLKLHPLYQLKYSFNPEIPRFYKFVVLYTRVLIMLAICFFVLRDFHDFEQVFDMDDLNAISLVKFLVIAVFGGIIFIPLPSLIYRCVRSRYFLIRQKERPSFMSEDDKLYNNNPVSIKSHRSPQDKNGPADENLNSQEQLQDYESVSNAANKHLQPQQMYEQERFTNVLIDTNLPIKLMFLLDRASTDKIIREYPTTMNYSSGITQSLGQKLFELDDDLHKPKRLAQNNSANQKYVSQPQVSQRELNPAKNTSQRNTDNELSDATTNRKLQPNISPKKMKKIEEQDLQESQPIPSYAQDNQESRDQFQASLSAVNRNSQSNKSQRPMSSLNMPELGIGGIKSQENAAGVVNPSDIDYEIRDEEEDYEGGEKEEQMIEESWQNQKDPVRGAMPKEVLMTNPDDDEEIKEDEEAHNLSLNQIQPSHPMKIRGSNQVPPLIIPVYPHQQHVIYSQQPNKIPLQGFPMIPPHYQEQSQYNEQQSYFPYQINPNMTDNELVIMQNISKSGTDILDSYLGSLESQLDADEKKELVEKKNYCGRLSSNILSLIVNLGILIVIFYFYIKEEFYLEDNNYVWVIVFFGTQILGFLIFDTIAIGIMTCAVNGGCCKKKKNLQLKWMREALYIYEDYRYIMNYVETRID